MNCLEFRRLTGAEPGLGTAQIEAHRAECAACARFQDQMRALDVDIGRALAVDDAALSKPARRGAGGSDRKPVPRWYALAASLALGVALAAALWVSFPAPTVADEVLDHLRHEPYAWDVREPVQAADIDAVLRPDGLRLREGHPEVTYAYRCRHRGQWVPHLVVRMPQGPVTVLVLGHREVAAATPVSDHEFTGVVMPAPRGSIAIAARADVDIDDIARQVFAAVDWDA